MDERPHTPEPWRLSMSGYSIKSLSDDMPIVANNPWGHGMTEKNATRWIENAERIVACVNACAGMADPVATITALREALAALIFPMEAWNEAIERVTGEQPVVIDALTQARAALALVPPAAQGEK